MQYYKTKIRLAGSTMNEVRKVLSAPEVLILQYIHGVDAIVEVSKVKNEKIKMGAEKARLKGKYDQSLVKRDTSIDAIFGALGALPEKLPDELIERFGIDSDDDNDIVELSNEAVRSGAASKSGREPETQVEADRLQTLVPADEVSMDDIMG